jgi:hypothetical protein
MELESSSETTANIYRTTRYHVPENSNLHSYRRERHALRINEFNLIHSRKLHSKNGKEKQE